MTKSSSAMLVDPVEILTDARDYLASGHWTRLALHDGNGKTCALGATYRSRFGKLASADDDDSYAQIQDESNGLSVAMAALNYVITLKDPRVWASDDSLGIIYDFNDTYSSHQVIEVFDEAITLLQEVWE